MVNTEIPMGRRKVIMNINNQPTWAGELYMNTSDTNVLGDYLGMYVELVVDDTIYQSKEILIELDVTLPLTVHDPEILIGEFDKTLKCIDTLYFEKLDSISDFHSFNYVPKKLGNDYFVGKLSLPDPLGYLDIYFFDGFFVKEN